jgi:hypothetical protein
MGRLSTIVACGLVILSVAGCAKREPKPEGERRAAEANYPPPPANSPMAKIQVGMSEQEVAKLIGFPDDSHAYITGKAFIPWYFGPDQSRFVCYYKGKGRVVFSGGNQWGAGRGKVQRVEYDPSEDGVAATQ